MCGDFERTTYEPGYDALRGTERIQIKGRVLGSGAKPGQRLGAIKLDYPWEYVLFVSLDEDLRPTGIWEASRAAVAAASIGCSSSSTLARCNPNRRPASRS
jgi:hypothetical protein